MSANAATGLGLEPVWELTVVMQRSYNSIAKMALDGLVPREELVQNGWFYTIEYGMVYHNLHQSSTGPLKHQVASNTPKLLFNLPYYICIQSLS